MAVKVLQALRQLTGFSGGTVDGGVPKKPPTPAVEALVSVVSRKSYVANACKLRQYTALHVTRHYRYTK